MSVVYDFDQDRAAQVAAEVGAVAVPSYQDLIASDLVDAVLIASPDHFHAEQALACLAAGKPTLCEKPLALQAAECKRLGELAASLKLPLAVGMVRRLVPAIQAARLALRNGLLGELDGQLNRVARLLSEFEVRADRFIDARLRFSNLRGLLNSRELEEDFRREAVADLPEAIDNTLMVARRCAVAAPKRKPILPSMAGDREGEARQLGARRPEPHDGEEGEKSDDDQHAGERAVAELDHTVDAELAVRDVGLVHFERRVRRVIKQADEERLVVLALNDFDRALSKQIGQVAFVLRWLQVFPQIVGTGRILVRVVIGLRRTDTVELIVAVAVGTIFLDIAEIPLADERGGIAGLFDQ